MSIYKDFEAFNRAEPTLDEAYKRKLWATGQHGPAVPAVPTAPQPTAPVRDPVDFGDPVAKVGDARPVPDGRVCMNVEVSDGAAAVEDQQEGRDAVAAVGLDASSEAGPDRVRGSVGPRGGTRRTSVGDGFGHIRQGDPDFVPVYVRSAMAWVDKKMTGSMLGRLNGDAWTYLRIPGAARELWVNTGLDAFVICDRRRQRCMVTVGSSMEQSRVFYVNGKRMTNISRYHR